MKDMVQSSMAPAGHGTRKGCHYYDTKALACEGVSWEWQGLPLPWFLNIFASQCHPPAESYGGVAQSVEQGTHKPCVTGSIPVAATNLHTQLYKPVCTDGLVNLFWRVSVSKTV